MKIFAAGWVLFAVLSWGASFCNADWTQIHCKGDQGDFIEIRRDSGGTLTIETEKTRTFLKGLSCGVPFPKKPLFYCSGANGMVFSSLMTRETGFSPAIYGRFSDVEYFSTYFSANYQDGSGAYQQVEKTSRYRMSSCVITDDGKALQ